MSNKYEVSRGPTLLGTATGKGQGHKERKAKTDRTGEARTGEDERDP